MKGKISPSTRQSSERAAISNRSELDYVGWAVVITIDIKIGAVSRVCCCKSCKKAEFPIRARNHKPNDEVSGSPAITRHSSNWWTDSYRISDARIRWRCFASTSARIPRAAGRRNLGGRFAGLFPIAKWWLRFGGVKADRIPNWFFISLLREYRFDPIWRTQLCPDTGIHSNICNRRT